MRRFAGFLCLLLALRVTFAGVDFACASHAQHGTVAAAHMTMPMPGAGASHCASTGTESKGCHHPSGEDCCSSLSSCDTTLLTRLRTGVAEHRAERVAPPLYADRALLRALSPETPPPRA